MTESFHFLLCFSQNKKKKSLEAGVLCEVYFLQEHTLWNEVFLVKTHSLSHICWEAVKVMLFDGISAANNNAPQSHSLVLLYFLMCIDFSLSITLSKLIGGPTVFGFQITFYGATRIIIKEIVLGFLRI